MSPPQAFMMVLAKSNRFKGELEALWNISEYETVWGVNADFADKGQKGRATH